MSQFLFIACSKNRLAVDKILKKTIVNHINPEINER